MGNERAPDQRRRIAAAGAHSARGFAPARASAGTRPRRRTPSQPSPLEIVPGAALQPTQLLSNGRYSVALRGNGAGWSRFGRADVSRWRDDALRDAYGTFFYLRRNDAGTPVSITEHPAPDRRRRRTARRSTPTGCISTPNGPNCARTARCGSARRMTSNCAGSSCGAGRRSRFASN